MSIHQRGGAFLAVASGLLAVTPASATWVTFTDAFDGVQYPANLNPGRQAGGTGGASASTFSPAIGLQVVSIHGNPSYFDANNLLTRPASLIDGDAFWADLRLGTFLSNGSPFSIAHLGFQFDNDGLDRDFGFDIALASASIDVPDVITFQIQDTNDNIAQGTFTFNPGDQFVQDAGSFFTLNSPRPGYEARLRFSQSELVDLLINDGATDVGQIAFFDLLLSGFTSPGGTNQVAIDNFVFDNAPVSTVSPLTFVPSTPPIGANTPQYFNYAAEAAPDAPPDTYDVDPALFESDFSAISVLSDSPTDLSNLGARAQTSGATVIFSSDSPAMGTAAHEVTHTLQRGPGSTPATPPTQSEQEAYDASTQVLTIVTSDPALGDSALAAGVAPSPQIVEVTTVLGDPSQGGDPLAFAIAASVADLGPMIGSPGDLTGLFLGFALSLDDLSSAGNGTQYLQFAATDYLQLKAFAGDPLTLGDHGFTVAPLLTTLGDTVSYRVSVWLVTDQSGIFTPTLVVPEPTAAALLVGGAVTLRRRRR